MMKVFLILWSFQVGSKPVPPHRIEMPDMETCYETATEKMAEATKEGEDDEAPASYFTGCLVEMVGGRPA
jgi:hypothetical protein